MTEETKNEAVTEENNTADKQQEDVAISFPTREEVEASLQEKEKSEEPSSLEAAAESVKETESEASPMSEQEKEARALGWLPKEEFKGTAENWSDVTGFLKIRSLSDTVNRYKKDLKLLTKKMDEFLTQNDQKTISDLEEKSNQILEMKREAIKAGRVEDAEKLEEAYYAHKQQLEQKSNAKQPLPDAVVDFQERHKDWLGREGAENNSMTVFAVELDKEIRNASPELDDEIILDKVEKEVKRVFSHRFESPAIPKQTIKSSVDAITHKKSGPKKVTFAQLPPGIKAVVNSMCRNSGSLSKDEYAQQLYNMGRVKI